MSAEDPLPPGIQAAIDDDVGRRAIAYLRGLSRASSVAPWVAYDFLAENSAGLPFKAMIDEAARDDARFWAETASPAELECYAVAAIDRLRSSPLGARQLKRLLGGLWRVASPAEKEEFLKWAERHERQ